MEKDWNYIAKLEKAISQKYGKLAAQNPKSEWDEKKEEQYLLQLKELADKERKIEEQSEKVETNGFLVPKKLLNKELERTCLVCETYSFDIKDDVYMLKFDCCFKCFVQHIEGREERWSEGWRPNKGDK
jgi:hypothetical protein